MKKEWPLISVIIPAYNLPDYTRKTLHSIVEQEYRPIEILISDDCSPISLEPLVEEFRMFESNNFYIKYFRQTKNLRHDNMTFLFDRCTGKYFCNIQHDDWWIDKNFLFEAVKLMEDYPDCHMCVANSEIEGTNGQTMINLGGKLNTGGKWRVIEGDVYMKLFGANGIGFQARSGIVIDVLAARSFEILRYPYNISESLAKELSIMSDDGFSFQFLLSSIGSIAITEKVVGVRGMPSTSYSKALGWDKFEGQALFIIYYNLYRSDMKGKYATKVKQRAKEFIFHFPVEKLNRKILKHFNYSLEVVWLMSLSYLLYIFRWPVYFINFFRRIFYRIWTESPIKVFRDIQNKFKERGLLRSLFPTK